MRIRFWALQREALKRDLDECESELSVSFVLVALVSRARRQGRQRGEHVGPASDL